MILKPLVGGLRLQPKEIPTGDRRPHHTEEDVTMSHVAVLEAVHQGGIL